MESSLLFRAVKIEDLQQEAPNYKKCTYFNTYMCFYVCFCFERLTGQVNNLFTCMQSHCIGDDVPPHLQTKHLYELCLLLSLFHHLS